MTAIHRDNEKKLTAADILKFALPKPKRTAEEAKRESNNLENPAEHGLGYAGR